MTLNIDTESGSPAYPGSANVTSSNRTILVLWGQSFDEIAASIFVCELRRMGKRVKLVGLKHQHIAGQHGLTLVPDLTLGQALQAGIQTSCIIVPAPLTALQQFSYDPRLAELLQLAADHAALVVETSSNLATSKGIFPRENMDTIQYPHLSELLKFIHEELILHIG